MKREKQFFGVDYTWTEAGQPRYGRTVVTGKSQADAEGKLANLHSHLRVLHSEPPKDFSPLAPVRSSPAAAGMSEPRGRDRKISAAAASRAVKKPGNFRVA